MSGQEVTLGGHAGTWHAEFVDMLSSEVLKTRTVKAKDSQLEIPLPTFQEAIALRLTASIQRRGDRVEMLFALVDEIQAPLNAAPRRVDAPGWCSQR